MQNPFSMKSLTVGVISYRVTDEIIAKVDQAEMERMVLAAEQARQKRGIEITKESMYFVRFQQPPSPRLMVVVFMMSPDGERMNVLAYYDEVEEIFRPGWESGDIKPFDKPLDMKYV